MNELKKHLDGVYSCIQINLNDKKWHTKANIPSKPGWYFINTNTPIEILSQQNLWGETYQQKKNNKQVKVCNYNIAERAKRFTENLSVYWNVTSVYSGMASNLQSRAREHTGREREQIVKFDSV